MLVVKRSLLFRFLLGIILAFGTAACDSDEDENAQGSGASSSYDSKASAKIDLYSSGLVGGASLNLASDVESCSLNMDIYSASGLCITPSEFKGYSTYIYATTSTDTNPDSGSARLAGVAGSSEAEGNIFNGAEFSFATKDSPFTGFNELWDQYPYRQLYDYIAIDLAYEKIRFELKGKFVELLVVSSDQPFASGDIVDTCGVPEADREQSRYTNADLLTGLSFKRGDYLFCVKDSDVACEASDFKWLDLDNTELVSTRPLKPRVHSYVAVDQVNCSTEQYGISIGVPAIHVAAKLSEGFKLWADFSNGINSNEWKDARAALGRELTEDENNSDYFEEPYAIYTHEDISGTQQTGTTMQVNLDFDLSQMLFIEGYDDEEDLAAVDMAVVLSQVYAKHDWVFQKKHQGNVVGYGPEQIYSMDVSASVALSGEQTRPE